MESIEEVAKYYEVPEEEVRNWKSRGCPGLVIIPYSIERISNWIINKEKSPNEILTKLELNINEDPKKDQIEKDHSTDSSSDGIISKIALGIAAVTLGLEIYQTKRMISEKDEKLNQLIDSYNYPKHSFNKIRQLKNKNEKKTLSKCLLNSLGYPDRISAINIAKNYSYPLRKIIDFNIALDYRRAICFLENATYIKSNHISSQEIQTRENNLVDFMSIIFNKKVKRRTYFTYGELFAMYGIKKLKIKVPISEIEFTAKNGK